MNNLNLILQKAIDVRKNAYAPYSNFKVGACILSTSGNFYVGCNVENASYGLGICAEGSAICQMIAGGDKDIQEIVIIGSGTILCSPCGACRQRLLEFATLDTPIHMGNKQGIQKTMSLNELIPCPFGPRNLEKE